MRKMLIIIGIAIGIIFLSIMTGMAVTFVLALSQGIHFGTPEYGGILVPTMFISVTLGCCISAVTSMAASEMRNF